MEGILSVQDEILNRDGFKMKNVLYYTNGFKNGLFTPIEIASKIINIIENKNNELKSICDYNKQLILEQAAASTERWKNGKPISLVDGVPAVVKDHIFVKDLTARNGLEMENEKSESPTFCYDS